ncbi:MAG: T9SS type A sorting domain-containing protein [FCB group bacterium]|nr:T9SS type A sorting domain-containing protein [FCB group bacterium]MBL7028194.1 T9SS type A sorting domain-containing protein [Candidatus Neomarinimicrobiota bacterium]MBL7122500.1 T9SS type A sorting domain-containing protein [Candidatus Neomarinimicrobiota bacterium]
MHKKILILTSLLLLIPASRSCAQDSLYTSISGDTLTIHHDETERNCAALFTWDVNIVDNLITVTEVDTGDQAWCMCTFDLEVGLTGLDPGSYQIDVWSNDIGSDPIFHGSLNLDWGNLSTTGHAESDCLNLRDDTSFVELSVSGDTLNLFWNTPMLNCIFMPVWSGWLDADTFRVAMVDTGPPVDCICPFEVEASFASFAPGTYTLDFWNGEYGYPQFNISGLRDGLAISGEYQSPCYNITTISEEEDIQKPDQVLVDVQSYPNPFNSQTMITYRVLDVVDLSIQIYSIEGSFVQTIARHSQTQPGRYNISWSGINASGEAVGSGVYLLVIQYGTESSVNRLLLLK